MDRRSHQSIIQNVVGSDFHFLPFISIFGASAVGAVNGSLAMLRDGVPPQQASVFFLLWCLVTCVLLAVSYTHLRAHET